MTAVKQAQTLRYKMPYPKITLFTKKLATLTTAGIPLVQALNIICNTINKGQDPRFHALIYTLKRKVESGHAFYAALKNIAAFDALYCSLIYAAEQSGTLDSMLGRICLHREKIQNIKAKIRKALFYPLFILVTAIGAMVILLIFVVPTFKEIFASLNAKLPPFTQAVLSFADIIQSAGIYIALGFSTLIVCFLYYYRRHHHFRYRCQKSILSLPYIGSLLQKHHIASISQTLSTMIEAGIPLIQALKIVSTTDNLFYQKITQNIQTNLLQGQSLGQALQKTNAFPTLVEQLIVIGEEAGELAAIFHKIAQLYEGELDTHIDRLTSLLEPLMIILMGTLIGGLVIAMFLPIFEMGALF